MSLGLGQLLFCASDHPCLGTMILPTFGDGPPGWLGLQSHLAENWLKLMFQGPQLKPSSSYYENLQSSTSQSQECPQVTLLSERFGERCEQLK